MCRETPLVILLALVLCAAIAGCGKKESAAGATADATAKAFAEAMEAGQYEQAATAFDYLTEARKQNENWDDIPAGERAQITKKVAAQKADELKAVKQRLGSGIKAGTAQGDTVSVGGSGGSVTLQIVQREGKWYVSALW